MNDLWFFIVLYFQPCLFKNFLFLWLWVFLCIFRNAQDEIFEELFIPKIHSHVLRKVLAFLHSTNISKMIYKNWIKRGGRIWKLTMYFFLSLLFSIISLYEAKINFFTKHDKVKHDLLDLFVSDFSVNFRKSNETNVESAYDCLLNVIEFVPPLCYTCIYLLVSSSNLI